MHLKDPRWWVSAYDETKKKGQKAFGESCVRKGMILFGEGAGGVGGGGGEGI